MSSAPTTCTARAADWLGYQLATRPRLRSSLMLWLATHVLASWSVSTAPPAAAATIGGALNWTGVTDSHGVPVGAYYLSVVSTTEAITHAGPALGADPSSWTRWLASALTTGLTHETVVELLQAQAAAYIFLMALALWLMRFAMSNTWLYWLATWFRPIFEAIRAVLAQMWVFPICLALGLGVGAFHILWHGRKGFGTGILLSTFAVGVLSMALTADPLSDLYSEDGLITQGLNLGFGVAQAALANGSLGAGGSGAQLAHLTGLIADATVRMPVQLMNFGSPVDDIGSCGSAYTAAMLTPHDPGDLAGPAHAMADCGAPHALSFAQHLSGANLALGVFYCLLGGIFAFFVCYVTYSYVTACCAALVNALLCVVVAAPAMIHGAPRQRAGRRLVLFFKHAALLFAYTAYISTAAIIVLKMAARGGFADQVGMTHPLARLVMIALVSAVAIGVFRWLKRELGDHTRHDLTHLLYTAAYFGRGGYRRGRRSRDRDTDSTNGRGTASPTDRSTTPGQPDQPHTGPPVNGRPPGGRPPSPGRSRPRPPTAPTGASPASATTTPGATARPAGSTTARAASAAASTGEAVATVAAPEVVVGAAVAAHVTQKNHRGRENRSAPIGSDPKGHPSAPSAADTAALAPPAAGRSPQPAASISPVKPADPGQASNDRASDHSPDQPPA